MVPLPDFGFEVQRAAVFVDHHGAGDRQALARALADFLGGEERIEDARTHFDRNALAGVADGDLDRSVEHPGADGDQPLLRRAV